MSTNISKLKRDELIEKIKTIKNYIFSAPQDENTIQLISYINEIEKEIKQKKYGLVFEEHRENTDEILQNNLPVFSEISDLSIVKSNQYNFLLEGDNLASLKLLEKTHSGKIKVIYIDPPYNRGKDDFIYDDNFVVPDDSFKHSKWCSFMYPRLKIAQKLLSNDGLIFISIDDNELASLIMLCNEIFGDDNFIGCLPTIMNLKGNQDEFGFAGTHEYTIVYARSLLNTIIKQFETTDDELEGWLLDEIGYYKKGATLKRTGQDAPRTNRPYGYFPILINNQTKLISVISEEEHKSIYDPNTKMFDDIYVEQLIKEYTEKNYTVLLPTIDGQKTSWRWSRTKVEKESNDIIVVGDSQGYSLYKKQRPELGDLPSKKPKTLLYKPDYSSGNGTSQLKKIFEGKKVFNNPKPIELIKDLIMLGSNSDSLILDFFAGSGTTGHAVMKLNSEDKGNRRFILCTNNENNICREVTYERLKRVIEKENYFTSLKYFKIDYIPISDKLYYEYADELLAHIRELVELENAINFNDNNEIAIILTEEELEQFTSSLSNNLKYKAIYLGHDVLPSVEHEKILAAKNIKVNIIPDYYYKELEG